MLNQVMRHNQEMFTKELSNFTNDYFDNAERYITGNYLKKGKVLVLGCGAGRTLIPLYKMGYSVTGIDINPVMIAAAKKKVASLSIKIVQMDATKLQFKANSFDSVFFPFHGIDYVYPNIYAVVEEACRVLKPNGVFVFNSHSRLNLKALPRFFEGKYANYYGYITYRTTPIDYFKLKKYFKTVKSIPATSLLVTWKKATWKEKIYKLLPFFDASFYYICIGKK